MIATLLGFAASLILIFLRVPIAVAMGIVGFVGFGYEVGWVQSANMVALISREAAMSYTLAIIPLFILMGNLIADSGISRDLFACAQALLGGRRGGLANATIAACAVFGMVCGSTVATVMTMGRISLPAMRERGYSDGLSSAVIAVGGTLGVLIPPSVLLVIYGVITETHIGKLYAAVLIPSATAILGYILVVAWFVRRYPDSAPKVEHYSRAEKKAAILPVWPVLVLFVLVLGGIYTGITTATEAAGIGAFGAFLLVLFSRRVNWASMYRIFVNTAEATGVIFMMLIGGKVFAEFLNYTGAHMSLQMWVTDAALSPLLVMAVICAIYFVLGALMDELSMVLLTVPFFLPIVVSLGYDPVWFGVIVITLCTLGMITPPIGINLFVVSNLAPDINVVKIVRGVVPFIVMDLLRLAILVLVPWLSLFLPNLFFTR